MSWVLGKRFKKEPTAPSRTRPIAGAAPPSVPPPSRASETALMTASPSASPARGKARSLGVLRKPALPAQGGYRSLCRANRVRPGSGTR